MAVQGDDYISRGDLVREVRKLRREVEQMKAEKRLPNASIDGGNLRVKGGAIVILDADGEETMRLATDGLTIEGFLDVLGDVGVEGGVFRWEDEDGDVRMSIGLQGTTNHPTAESVRLIYNDASDNQRVIVGEIVDEATGSLNGHGILVQLAGDPAVDTLAVRDGQALLGTSDGFVVFEDGRDDEIDLYDAAGNFRATIGRLASGDYGALIVNPDGSNIAEISDGEIRLHKPDGSAAILRITNADGLRVAVDTDAAGVQSGPVTAGAADSAGAGFRTLRIPN